MSEDFQKQTGGSAEVNSGTSIDIDPEQNDSLEVDPRTSINTEQGNNKKTTRNVLIFSILSFLLIISGIIGWYFYTQYESNEELPVNHLIEGVPYYGVYNLYPDYTSVSMATAIILRYYNDTRVSFGEIKNQFPGSRHVDDNVSNYRKARVFFAIQGYNTFGINLAKKEYEKSRVDEIKQFIKKDIPVMVIQKKRLDTNEDDIEQSGWRVVIGVFDNNKRIIVHDSALGNNYKLSYAEFDELFLLDASEMLAVWPKEDLAKQLPAPGNNLPYQEQSKLMKDGYKIIGDAGRARIAASTADELCKPNTLEDDRITSEFLRLQNESIQYRDAVISNPVFTSMTPLFQFRNRLWRARSIIRTGEVTKGREILLNELIPINKDLDRSVDGFELLDLSTYSDDPTQTSIVINGQMPYIWQLLSYSYLLEGRYNDAREAYLKYLEINPDNKHAQEVAARYINNEFAEPKRSFQCIGGKDVIK